MKTIKKTISALSIAVMLFAAGCSMELSGSGCADKGDACSSQEEINDYTGEQPENN
ncbi:hypothetical protein [Sedimentisphaera salicampi]|uniref:Uncharacterized protein n=1 Tax=Sedimentisphaera salicampi TaxID=1941349 RepID=A0A1W6LL09_9BACT|nr:hypothetical protein [Sedimentisphaera salicampi]ARN56445.1 hypothetical protein STSP1_00827 [Sedimentisphaera salicampi]OXU15333.1 hypothetical protein SMSP1_00813 [Sedimentisphaera salicampi]